MAVTGTFVANFDSFYDAVQLADVKLVQFGNDAEKVGPKLNRMVDGFSGRRLIEDATLMARAIEEIGGVSNLTEKELKRVGATMGDATDKMRAMGQEVPPKMQAIADATKDANKASHDWMGTLTTMAGAVGIAFSAQAVLSFVGSVFSAADAIENMSKAWGMSSEAVQRYSTAATSAGASSESVGAAISTMNRGLVDGTDEYRAALEAVGLQYDTVKKMSPEESFRAIIGAIEGIDDPVIQADDALHLFGKSSKDLLPAIRSDFLAVADGAEVMSNETTKRLADAQAAWGRLKNAMVIHTGEMIGATMAAAEDATSSWGGFFRAASAGLSLVTGDHQAFNRYLQTAGADRTAREKREASEREKAEKDSQGGIQTSLKTTTQILADKKKADDEDKKNAEERKKALDEQKKAQDAYNDSLRKLVDTFSGGDLLDKANLWRQALDRTIPIYQMTRTQQDAVNKVMTDAIGVYEAIGEKAPDAIYAIANATRAAVPATNDLTNAVKNLNTTSVDTPVLLSRSTVGVQLLQTGIEQTRTPVSHLSDDVMDLGALFESMANSGSASFATIGDSIRTSVQVAGIGLQTLGAYEKATDRAGRLAALAAGAEAVNQYAIQSGAGPGTLATTGAVSGALAMAPTGNPYLIAAGAVVGGVTGYMEGQANEEARRRALDQMMKDLGPDGTVAGGLRVLAQEAHTAGVNIEAFYNAGEDPEKVQEAIQHITTAFEYQQHAMDTLWQTAEKYGFTLEELGPAMQRADLDKRAAELYQDFQLLIRGTGGDWDTVMGHMGADIQEFADQAMAFGIAVPEAMRPMLQRMVELGTLTDENGDAITDLADSNITFARSTGEMFDLMLESIQKLTDAISVGLYNSLGASHQEAEKLANGIKSIPDKTVHIDVQGDVKWNVPEPPDLARGVDLPGYQSGTDGFRNFGSGTPVMLHGWEAVVPRGDAVSAGGPPLLAGEPSEGRGDTTQIVIQAQGAFFDTPESMQRLADKVSNALTAKYALTNKFRAA